MAITEATAPGKIILFGEHAVVYGEPAIAAPLTQVRASAIVRDSRGARVRITVPDLGRDFWLDEANAGDPFAFAVRLVQEAAGLSTLPALEIQIESNIPIASGLGSGAATAAALIRALARHLHHPELSDDASVCALTYEVEKIHHGTPSGIDNTVVAYERPVYFVRRDPDNLIETFEVGRPLQLLVADTGHRSSTHAVVSDVRRQWRAEPDQFERIFAACGNIANEARTALATGDLQRLGDLFRQNHRWLQQMTVSSAALDRLVRVAEESGALGAKLSGGGRGGNMIALVTSATRAAVAQALLAAGATRVLATVLGATGTAGSKKPAQGAGSSSDQ